MTGASSMCNNKQHSNSLARLHLAIRRGFKALWIRVLFHSGLLRWAKWRLARKHAILVLAFHRVLSEEQYRCASSQHSVVIRKRTFADLLHYIAQHYTFLNLGQGLPAWDSLAKPRFAITFDDGWLDTYSNAFPVASQMSIPFMVFVCPGLLDRKNPFWPEHLMTLWNAAYQQGLQSPGAVLRSILPGAARFDSSEMMIEFLKNMSAVDLEHALKEMRQHYRNITLPADDRADATMSWIQISEMANANVSFGSHTLSHQILPNCADSAARQELAEAKLMIEAQLRRPCRCFAYPNGNHSARTREMVMTAGYDLAFSIVPGPWRRDTDLLAIPRLNICEAKVCTRSGTFSPLNFEYATFWKAYCATLKRA